MKVCSSIKSNQVFMHTVGQDDFKVTLRLFLTSIKVGLAKIIYIPKKSKVSVFVSVIVAFIHSKKMPLNKFLK